MTTVLRWEEPPPSHQTKIRCLCEELQERPGVWALIEEGCEVSYAEQSLAKSLRRNGAQARTRRSYGPRGEALASVWACWPEGR